MAKSMWTPLLHTYVLLCRGCFSWFGTLSFILGNLDSWANDDILNNSALQTLRQQFVFVRFLFQRDDAPVHEVTP